MDGLVDAWIDKGIILVLLLNLITFAFWGEGVWWPSMLAVVRLCLTMSCRTFIFWDVRSQYINQGFKMWFLLRYGKIALMWQSRYISLLSRGEGMVRLT